MADNYVKRGDLNQVEILKYLLVELGSSYKYVVNDILDDDNCFRGIEIRLQPEHSMELK